MKSQLLREKEALHTELFGGGHPFEAFPVMRRSEPRGSRIVETYPISTARRPDISTVRSYEPRGSRSVETGYEPRGVRSRGGTCHKELFGGGHPFESFPVPRSYEPRGSRSVETYPISTSRGPDISTVRRYEPRGSRSVETGYEPRGVRSESQGSTSVKIYPIPEAKPAGSKSVVSRQDTEHSAMNWRDPGRALRARLMQLDEKNGWKLIPDTSMERYVELSKKVLDRFMTLSVQTFDELIQAFLVGSRLWRFLQHVLPNHPDYNQFPEFRGQAKELCEKVANYVDELTVLLDQEAYEDYVQYNDRELTETGAGRTSATAKQTSEHVNKSLLSVTASTLSTEMSTLTDEFPELRNHSNRTSAPAAANGQTNPWLKPEVPFPWDQKQAREVRHRAPDASSNGQTNPWNRPEVPFPWDEKQAHDVWQRATEKQRNEGMRRRENSHFVDFSSQDNGRNHSTPVDLSITSRTRSLNDQFYQGPVDLDEIDDHHVFETVGFVDVTDNNEVELVEEFSQQEKPNGFLDHVHAAAAHDDNDQVYETVTRRVVIEDVSGNNIDSSQFHRLRCHRSAPEGRPNFNSVGQENRHPWHLQALPCRPPSQKERLNSDSAGRVVADGGEEKKKETKKWGHESLLLPLQRLRCRLSSSEERHGLTAKKEGPADHHYMQQGGNQVQSVRSRPSSREERPYGDSVRVNVGRVVADRATDDRTTANKRKQENRYSQRAQRPSIRENGPNFDSVGVNVGRVVADRDKEERIRTTARGQEDRYTQQVRRRRRRPSSGEEAFNSDGARIGRVAADWGEDERTRTKQWEQDNRSWQQTQRLHCLPFFTKEWPDFAQEEEERSYANRHYAEHGGEPLQRLRCRRSSSVERPNLEYVGAKFEPDTVADEERHSTDHHYTQQNFQQLQCLRCRPYSAKELGGRPPRGLESHQSVDQQHRHLQDSDGCEPMLRRTKLRPFLQLTNCVYPGNDDPENEDPLQQLLTRNPLALPPFPSDEDDFYLTVDTRRIIQPFRSCVRCLLKSE